MRAFFLLLVLSTAPTAAYSQQTTVRPRINFDLIFPSVVTLISYDADGAQLSQGSGFILRDKRIVTNRHVVEGARIVEIRNSTGEVLASLAHVEAMSSSADIVILPGFASLKPGLPLSLIKPKVGERLFAIGSPLGLPNSVSDGILSAIRTDFKTPLFQITAPISPGSSGGPVINERGEVLGVATASIREGQALNFAVPAGIVEALRRAPISRLKFPQLQPELECRQTDADRNSSLPRPASHPMIPFAGPYKYVETISYRLRRNNRIRMVTVFDSGRVYIGQHLPGEALAKGWEPKSNVRMATFSGRGDGRVSSTLPIACDEADGYQTENGAFLRCGTSPLRVINDSTTLVSSSMLLTRWLPPLSLSEGIYDLKAQFQVTRRLASGAEEIIDAHLRRQGIIGEMILLVEEANNNVHFLFTFAQDPDSQRGLRDQGVTRWDSVKYFRWGNDFKSITCFCGGSKIYGTFRLGTEDNRMNYEFIGEKR